jgi:hypothetical protein
VQPDERDSLPDAAQQALEAIDFQIRMQAALHKRARAARLEGIGDSGINFLVIENVSLGSLVALRRAIKCAVGTILNAEMGVVDIAVNDIGDHALRMQPAAYRICSMPKPMRSSERT